MGAMVEDLALRKIPQSVLTATRKWRKETMGRILGCGCCEFSHYKHFSMLTMTTREGRTRIGQAKQAQGRTISFSSSSSSNAFQNYTPRSGRTAYPSPPADLPERQSSTVEGYVGRSSKSNLANSSHQIGTPDQSRPIDHDTKYQE